jgi:hypothetical protein
VPDDHATLVRLPTLTAALPNAGIVFKVVPDETMRGLELRNGVDIVVNDLSPDLAWPAKSRVLPSTGRAPLAYIGLNLRDPLLSDIKVGEPLIRRRSRRDHQLFTPSLARRATVVPPCRGHTPPMRPATDVAQAKRLLDEAGYPDPTATARCLASG